MQDMYFEFIERRGFQAPPIGFQVPKSDISKSLYDFQKEVVLWALRKGRACIFEDCGLGKTIQQLEWGRVIGEKTKKPVLLITPLAVSGQTKKEADRFGIKAKVVHDASEISTKHINITNYEKLHKFDSSVFSGVILDESSILKNFSGKIRNQIIDMFAKTPYKLACSATPSPNDFMELGNHSEFLGIMSYTEMLSMFFINDSSDTGTWRLKKYAKASTFWKWLCSWAIMINHPENIGFQNDSFTLPRLEYIEHIIPTNKKASKGFFIEIASGMNERREVRKETIETRCRKAADIVNSSDEQFVVWCGLNNESKLLTKYIKDAIEVSGEHDEMYREKALLGFSSGEHRVIITKPSIAGFGMNWQNCKNAVFVGLNDSWEQFYQAVRRIWRFGQKRNVQVHIIIEEREGKVLQNIKRKDDQAKEMMLKMVGYTQEIMKEELSSGSGTKGVYTPEMEMRLPKWLQI